MLELNGRATLRLLAGAAVTIALGLTPQLAEAAAPGSLIQPGGQNSCIGTAGNTECSDTTGTGLNQSGDVAVSPDGKNVYVLGTADDAIAEFTRNPDGSLTEIGCVADSGASNSTCATQTANALVGPQAIVVTPDGNDVYVAASSGGVGAIDEFTRNSNGSLTELGCISESSDGASGCGPNDNASGIERPVALAISPDGTDLYAADQGGEDIAIFTRAGNGSLSQPASPDDCIQDSNVESAECQTTATGIGEATGVAVSPDGNSVYTTGFDPNNTDGEIAEFTRSSGGSLAQADSPGDCVETQGDNLGCGATAIGMTGITGLVISPDGRNVYTASEELVGPIAEFSRDASGALTQLPAPNDCIQEGGDVGCGQTGVGIRDGFELVISPDGHNVYAASESQDCLGGNCEDVAEFARTSSGSLTQLPSPDSCVQNASADDGECPGNANGHGLGGPGLAISPDGANVYVTGGGHDDVAALAVNHVLTVSATGSGKGTVSDNTGAIACPSACSQAYTANSQVTLTAAPASGSTFTGWSGACSGTGPCQVTMSADANVTATFTATGPPAPVLTSAPSAVTDAGAAFSGSVNPEGLATSVFFQYGLDKRYSTPGASGANYTQQTPAQSVGSDFAVHAIGPVSVSGLLPSALYHVRIVATNSAGTVFGQDMTFTTATSPAPSAPTIGQTFNIQPVSGLVFVYIHGQLVPLTDLEQIGPGVTIDSRHGTFELTSAGGAGGTAHDAAAKGKPAKTQTGQFGGAVLRIHQTTRGANRGLTTVMMVESAFKGAPNQAVCGGHSADGHATALSSKTIQLLHAKAHGKFSTSGRYSAATVRGTRWTMTARCDGTLTHVISDSVVVTDFVRHKTIILHAGQSYLAPIHRRR